MKYFFFLFLVSTFSHASFCDLDTKKFCPNLTGARGERAKCLSEHVSEISPKCAIELKTFKQNALKKNPCFQELIDYCADVPSSRPNVYFCLMKNESRLSLTCQNDFKPRKVKLLSEDKCAQDTVDTCYKEITAPQGAIVRCLIREKKNLSPACKIQVEASISEFRKTNPCFEDTEKYCPKQVRFIEIQECLEKKIKNLAPSCLKLVQRELNLSLSNPCYKDLTRFCRQGLNPETQDVCLDLNHKELSIGCQTYRKSEFDRLEKVKVACEVDRLKLCKNTPFKDGLVIECLKENKSRLSLECKSLL